MTLYRDQIDKKLGKGKGSLEVGYKCIFSPMCKLKYRQPPTLFINYKKGKFICFRCGLKGKIDYLLKFLGFAFIEESKPVPKGEELQKMKARLIYSHLRKNNKILIKEVLKPFTFSLTTNAKKYLNKRIENSIIKMYHLESLIDQKGIERVFIPVYNNFKLVYWVARSVQTTDFKYITCKDSKKSRAIFNYDVVKKYAAPNKVYICEGVFDCFTRPYDSIAIFGKVLSSDQFKLLQTLGNKEYVISLDSDARKESFRLFYFLKRKGYKVSMKIFHEGDPSENDYSESVNEFDMLRLRLKTM